MGNPPTIREHKDVAAHFDIEHLGEGNTVAHIPAIPMEHQDCRPSCGKLFSPSAYMNMRTESIVNGIGMGDGDMEPFTCNLASDVLLQKKPTGCSIKGHA